MRALKRAAAACLASILMLSLVMVPKTPVAANSCEDYVPDMGVIQAVGPWNGNRYHAVFEFLLTPEQVTNLQCTSEYLEIDFNLFGFDLPAIWPIGWQGYKIMTNLPGGSIGSSLTEGDFNTRKAEVTGVRTADLVGNKRYFSIIEWEAQSETNPKVEVTFAPSRWASGTLEEAWCWASGYRPDLCIFGMAGRYISELSKSKFPQFSEGRMPFYTSGPPYIFGPWSESTAPPASYNSPWQVGPLPAVTPPPTSDTPVPSSDIDGSGGSDLVFTALRGDGYADIRVALSNNQSFGSAGNMRQLDGFGFNGITPLAGDVNGDNKSDVVFVTDEFGAGIKVFVCLSISTGLSTPILWWQSNGLYYNHLKFAMGDMDNNGADDLVMLARAGQLADVRVLLSSWSYFTDVGVWKNLAFGYDGIKFLVGDVSGDKFADVVLVSNENQYGVKAFTLTSSGYSLNNPTLWWSDAGYSWAYMKPVLGDMDNNGRGDLLFAAKRGDGYADLRVLLSSGSQFNNAGLWRQLDGFGFDGMTLFVADVNNDNAADAVFVTREGVGSDAFVCLSTTTGLSTVQHWWEGSGYSYDGIRVSLN